jgi:hypothetical protein
MMLTKIDLSPVRAASSRDDKNLRCEICRGKESRLEAAPTRGKTHNAKRERAR